MSDDFDPACCHRTRLVGAPCPAGRQCPYDDLTKSEQVNLMPELRWELANRAPRPSRLISKQRND